LGNDLKAAMEHAETDAARAMGFVGGAVTFQEDDVAATAVVVADAVPEGARFGTLAITVPSPVTTTAP
jgi:hypothetical protein